MKSFIISISSVALAISFFSAFLFFNGLVINYTDSYPLGIYKKEPLPKFLEKGMIVLFCLPRNNIVGRMALERGYLNSGRCDGGLMPLVKRIVGKEGDYITISNMGVKVNEGDYIANTIPVYSDSKGRYLPIAENRKISSNNYFVVSEYNPKSFDSRYFGEISKHQISHIIKPYLVLGDYNYESK